jgi:hypothetical protein
MRFEKKKKHRVKLREGSDGSSIRSSTSRPQSSLSKYDR